MTWYVPFFSRVPDVYPTTNLAGMPSNRESTVIAYADCTQKPLLLFVRKACRPSALSNSAAPRLYLNCGPDSQFASAFTSPISVSWPAAYFRASCFRADVSYDGGSC